MNIPRRLKQDPHRKQYIKILQGMTGEQRMRIGFELFEMAKKIMIEGIKVQNPDFTQEDIQREVVRRMMRYHKRNSLRRSYKF